MPDILYPVKKLVHLTEEQARKIADYRFENRLQSENEAIRRLIDKALTPTKKKEAAR